MHREIETGIVTKFQNGVFPLSYSRPALPITHTHTHTHTLTAALRYNCHTSMYFDGDIHIRGLQYVPLPQKKSMKY